MPGPHRATGGRAASVQGRPAEPDARGGRLLPGLWRTWRARRLRGLTAVAKVVSVSWDSPTSVKPAFSSSARSSGSVQARHPHSRSASAVTLVIRLAALAETIADLRQIQQRAAQAAAARTAAERLRSLTRPHTEPPPRSPRQARSRRPRTAAEVAALTFPFGPLAQAPPHSAAPVQGAPASRHPTAAPTRRGRAR